MNRITKPDKFNHGTDPLGKKGMFFCQRSIFFKIYLCYFLSCRPTNYKNHPWRISFLELPDKTLLNFHSWKLHSGCKFSRLLYRQNQRVGKIGVNVVVLMLELIKFHHVMFLILFLAGIIAASLYNSLLWQQLSLEGADSEAQCIPHSYCNVFKHVARKKAFSLTSHSVLPLFCSTDE